MSTCSSYLIRIPGYRLNKAGEVVPDVRRLSALAEIVQDRQQTCGGKC